MASAHPAPALRPMLPADAPILAAIFRESIFGLTADDYSAAQQEAWASRSGDIAAFGQRLAGYLTLIATFGGSPVAFASLKGKDHVEMLFVHPAAAGQGAARLLLDALEKLAAARGAERLSVDASDTARGFFEKQGFVAERRNTVAIGEEWLGNTHMVKRFAANRPAPTSAGQLS